jgi:hypothetical protein|tara:strand:- start:445 stop:744 length:300 start_codon:yes stop_codon:yes gene_type:complete
MINLNTITLQELQELLDKKLNFTMGWASTVFSQDDLKIISKNLLELLKSSDDYFIRDIAEVEEKVFYIYLKIVIDIYEGFVELEPRKEARTLDSIKLTA